MIIPATKGQHLTILHPEIFFSCIYAYCRPQGRVKDIDLFMAFLLFQVLAHFLAFRERIKQIHGVSIDAIDELKGKDHERDRQPGLFNLASGDNEAEDK